MNEQPKFLRQFTFGFREDAPGAAPGSSVDDDSPLRAELFSAQQMAAHGKVLASSHELSQRQGPDRLLARLRENADVIAQTCDDLTAAVKSSRQITPASEWLLDNSYLIEEQIRTARRHLPKNYSKELPRLARGAPVGTPRVYQIALEIIAHGDGRVDPESLCRFVDAYQEVATLKLGELWAIPIMLRLALIENLRRVAARVADNRIQRDLANSWADQMMEIADQNPSGLILLVADMARSNPPLSSGFVAELARRLQGQSAALTLALTWLTHRLAEAGLTIEQMIQQEIQTQSAEQVSIANSIGSLRFLGTMDWQEFVETMSVVEQTLRLDPAGVYGEMDFATRDQYRHVIEKLARRSSHGERDIAAMAVDLARSKHGNGGDPRLGHVGYYLISRGVLLLEKQAGVRWPLGDALQQTSRASPLTSYLGAVAAITVVLAGLAVERALRDGVQHWLLALVGVLAVAAGNQLALALTNWAATLLTRPNPLPRMDYRNGIPADARALVVVPTLIFSKDNVDELVEQMEVRFLANRDPNVRFCLLTDFADAPQEHLPGDAALLQQAHGHIVRLNEKYTPGEDATPQGSASTAPPIGNAPAGPFLLLHRARRWNPSEGVWMGRERKRGKLEDLNRFLRGGARDCFALVAGDVADLESIRYVITLDTDTRLPRDAARQFVASMQHPLNRPRVDPRRNRVVDGYGILQPRVAVSLPSEHASRYERLCGGEPGIDPYTRTVSDVYQDVFYEGSFIGKGIYDVDVFEQVLGGRLPDNRILSHDLLEGCYLRAGLLSDAQLYEQYPASYSDDILRRQRWIRGDWQLLPWLMPRTPLPPPPHAEGRPAGREPNPLSWLSRWKLFDNLRRSLAPAVLALALLLAWTVLPEPGFWTMALLAVVLVPPLASAVYDLLNRPRDTLWSQHMAQSLWRSRLHFAHALLTMVFLPYEAYVSIDAIARTAWRLLVSKRRLLQWRASALACGSSTPADYWRTMWMAPVAAVAVAAVLAGWQPDAYQERLAAAMPLLLAWLAAPLVAWWISRPQLRELADLSNEQGVFLHMVARRTWAYFDTFVGPDDNWLPPDNVQEHPAQVIAHRTSPTNMGMALLANLSAHDFGYISGVQLITRTGNTLTSMAKLERHQGHFYNWYDTVTMKPLHPVYISSVDSGNLAGHLLTLQQGLLQQIDQPIAGGQLLQGIATTIQVLAEAVAHAGGAPPGVQPAGHVSAHLPDALLALGREFTALQPLFPATLPDMHALLERAVQAAWRPDGADPDVQYWASPDISPRKGIGPVLTPIE